MQRKGMIILFMILIGTMVMSGCRNFSVKNPLSGNGGVINVPVMNTTSATAFNSVALDKIGDHTYLEEDFYKKRSRSSEEEKGINAALEEADRSLKEDIYVYGVSLADANGDYKLYANPLPDGVILQEVILRAEKDNGISYRWSQDSVNVQLPDYDKNKALPASMYFDAVFELATLHENEMFQGGKKEPIQGIYVLKADLANGLYYEFTINENSTVRIDAQSGKIISQNFWDGVYVD